MKAERQKARDALGKVKEFEAKYKELEPKVGQLAPEVETELTNLRKFHQVFNAANDPEFQKEYLGAITAKETALFDWLKDKGLPDPTAEEIKTVAKANGGDLMAWPKWNSLLTQLQQNGDVMGETELRQALMDRKNAIAAKDAKLAELSKAGDQIFAQRAEKQKERYNSWGTTLSQTAAKLTKEHEWAWEKPVPENATAEVKSAIEAHNAKVKEHAGVFAKHVYSVIGANGENLGGDPAAVAELAWKATIHDKIAAENAELTAKVETQNRRIKDLEDRIAKVRNAGKASVESSAAPVKPAKDTTVEADRVGGDGNAAFAGFFGGR
jgi:hypothetical protein